ncbi:hypothetical protein C0Q70_14233 [Pomacea canaliculata]|uniref:Hemoglobinase n=1 Tax=Pomacea canaliculata TaxID=400727 RepID=A0A2T7NZI6_POMCA|nr:hypothetical protein C0Q70_14233 [Pomacea canaliculata]
MAMTTTGISGDSSSFNVIPLQADICHAYHVMSNHGIPDDQIVVMMYDDIANNKENPYKGNIINQPNGTNVYPGVLKDYTKKEVTPKVFLSVLSGDQEGVEKLIGRKGKVINSGPNDHVFVYLLTMVLQLHAPALQKTILKMYENKRYGKMVFYVEACESGSMFAKLLPKNISVYATTASNPHESSYACYFDKHRNTYLGDCYSVFWLQDSDKENLQQETLQKQFQVVKNETKTSHVMEYGNLTIATMTVAQFQGQQSGKPDAAYNARTAPNPLVDAMPSRQVPLFLKQQKVKNAKSLEERKAAEKELTSLKTFYQETQKLFMDIVGRDDYFRLRTQRLSISKWECYENAVTQLETSCPGMRLSQNDIALEHLYLLVNTCETSYSDKKLTSAIKTLSENRPFCQESN